MSASRPNGVLFQQSPSVLSDGDPWIYGTGKEMLMLWNDADLNAHCGVIDLPDGGAVNVPVLAIGVDIWERDLGFFNGQTQPLFSVVNVARTAHADFGFNNNGTAVMQAVGAPMTLVLGGTIAATVSHATGIDGVSAVYDDLGTLITGQTYRSGYFRYNIKSTVPSNPTAEISGVEGVVASYKNDEALTARGGYFRTYISADTDATATLRTSVGMEASARASYAGGPQVAAEGGTAFMGARIWMAPYFSAATVGNVNNFWGLWIYGEHATQRNADAAIFISDAGGGWKDGINITGGCSQYALNIAGAFRLNGRITQDDQNAAAETAVFYNSNAGGSAFKAMTAANQYVAFLGAGHLYTISYNGMIYGHAYAGAALDWYIKSQVPGGGADWIEFACDTANHDIRITTNGSGNLILSPGTTGVVSLPDTKKLTSRTGVIGLSVVSTAFTIGTAGSVILPVASMSIALNDAARDVLAGNIDGATAVDPYYYYLRYGSAWEKIPVDFRGGAPAKLTTTASAALKASDNTEKTTNNVAYTKIKEILVKENHTPSVRIALDLRSDTAIAETAYAKIYKNGVAIGLERTNATGAFVTFTEDLGPFVAGELLQVYAHTGGTDPAHVRNFQLSYDIALDTATALATLNQDP